MTKLCENQREILVAKLTDLFKGLEAEMIDEVVKEAKKRAIAEMVEQEVKKWRNQLAALFDKQIKTLESRGCPKVILEMFQAKRATVLAKAAKIEIPEGHIPFVPVIPLSYRGLYDLISMVRNGEKVGYTYLDPNEIINNVKAPKGLYFIYDVEGGEVMINKSPEEAERLIAEQERSCLTVEESIALCVHTNVLSKHYVDCTASRGRAPTGLNVPNIHLYGGNPILNWKWKNADSPNHKWGSPSCRIRA